MKTLLLIILLLLTQGCCSNTIYSHRHVFWILTTYNYQGDRTVITKREFSSWEMCNVAGYMAKLPYTCEQVRVIN